MPLRPLGDRVLIKPAKNPDMTTSGLILPETRVESYLEMQGTIVAVGLCPHPLKHEAESLALRLDHFQAFDDDPHDDLTAQAAALLRDVVRREPSVQIGDDVLFSWSAGQLVQIDDEDFLMMRESDLLAVIESEPV